MSKVFVKFNTGVPASAACERLFSVGRDVFSAKWNQLSDKKKVRETAQRECVSRGRNVVCSNYCQAELHVVLQDTLAK